MTETILMLDPNEVVLDRTPAADPKLLAVIKEAGRVLVPILVYMSGDKFYIMDGRSRVVCARKLGHKVPARVLEVSPLLSGAAVTLAANVRTRNPISAAHAIAELETGGVGDDSLLALSGMSKSQRKATKRLLKLAEYFQDLVTSRELSVGAAKSLARLDHEGQARAWKAARAKVVGKRVPARLVTTAVKDIIAEQYPIMQIPRPSMDGEYGGTAREVALWLRAEANTLHPHQAADFIRVAEILEAKDEQSV
jgi:ParB-like chromosome segregation protein Spo0J